MSLILRPPTDNLDLRDRLAVLRDRMRRLVLTSGLCALAAAALAIVLIAGGLDWLLNVPSLLRAGLLLGSLFAAFAFVRNRIVRPWRELNDEVALALRVEKQFPSLNDALASAVEFEDAGPGSEALRAETRRQALRETSDCDFDQLLDVRSFGRSGLALTALLLVGGALAVVVPGACAVALMRLSDPFGNHPWPPATLLDVEAPEWLARGEPFVLRGELRGVIPDRVGFRYGAEGAGLVEQPLAVIAGDEVGSFSVRLEPNKVARSFRYRLTANDSDTGWKQVSVVLPPQLVARDGRPSPQVHLDYPPYSEQPPYDLPDGGSIIEGVVGTVVTLLAEADRTLSAAWIEVAPDPPTPLASSILAMIGPFAANEFTGRAAAAHSVWGRHYATLDASRMRLELPFTPPVSGRYLLRFADDAGLTGRHELEVRVTLDPSPTVHLERPAASNSYLSVLPDATVPIRARIDDPVFAVRSAWLEYRPSPDSMAARRMLADTDLVGRTAPAMLTEIPVRDLKLRPTGLIVDSTFDLKPVRHVDGRPLQDGDVVVLHVAANDFDDLTRSKPPGRSHEVELRIVSAAGLNAILQKSQAEIQRELAALHALQRESRELAGTVDRQRRERGTLRPEDRERLVQAEQTQQQIQQRLGNENEGLRAAVDRLRQTLRDNPLPRTPERDRANALAPELDRLVREELEPVNPLLASARSERGPVPPEERKSGPLPQAVQHQQEAERTLRELAERMQTWSETRELRAEAGLLERDQTRVAQQREQLDSEPAVRGTNPDRLPPAQREALNRLKERQAALADRANELAQKIDQRIAEKQDALAAKSTEADRLEAQSTDRPDSRSAQARAEDARDAATDLQREAEALQKARELMQSQPSLPAQLRSAADRIEANKLGEARTAQEGAVKSLQGIQEALSEANPDQADRLAKKLKAAERDVNELLDDQERLQKRASDARNAAETPERKETLERLAREQADLRDRAEELAQRLSRQRGEPGAQEMRRAARAMEQAREQIENGEPADTKTDDALDRLDDAQQQLEQARKKLEDELQRERQAKLLEALKGYRTRQEALIVESDRLFESAKREKEWGRALLQSLIDLGRAEQNLSVELVRFADGEVKEMKVVVHVLRDAADAMARVESAIESIRNGPLDVESWEDDRRTVQAPQRLAAKRLAQLIDTVQDAMKEPAGEQSGGKPGEEPKGGAPGGDGIPQVAQLKLLRTLQAELNERTAAFATERPDPSKWTPADREELASIRRSQAELASLLEEITANEEPKEPPKEEKK